ncbi:MAG: hypothetical protein GY715_01475, partial [Planctomycetes bacterium]|nr:hypothetical protein [Planctomycetota bacterium]
MVDPRILLTVLLAFTTVLAGPRTASSHTTAPSGDDPPARELLVPLDDLNVLLEGPTRRVLLPRREYEALLAEATRDPVLRPPRSAAVISATYSAVLSEQRARIDGTLRIDVLESGLHALGLDLGGVGLRRATLDGKDAPIGRSDDGRLVLFVGGVGRHRLALELVAPVATDSARQVLDVRVPTPAATRFSMIVPGDVEAERTAVDALVGVAGISDRVFDEKELVTRFELVPRRDQRVTLVMTLNSRLKRTERLVVSRSVMVSEVTRGRERLHATISLAVLHRAVDEFCFRVPDGFEMTEVNSPHLARWTVVPDGGARATLVVKLREPTTETVVISATAQRNDARLEQWSMPVLEPLETAGQTALLGLLIEDRLRVQSIVDRGLAPVDVAVLAAALPPTLLARSAGTVTHDTLRPVAAYYAPDASGFEIDATFEYMPAELRARTNVLLTLSRTEHEVLGGFALAPRQEKLFSFVFTAPHGWHVKSVTDEGGAELQFRQIDGASDDEPSTVLVRGLGGSAGIDPGAPKTVSFTAVRTPSSWLEQWSDTEVALPVFKVLDASRETGAIAVLAEDDLEVTTDEVAGLIALDENEMSLFGLGGVGAGLAFSFDQHPYRATLQVTRRGSRVTARTYSFLKIEPETLGARYELHYEVTQARTRELSLLLPASTPEALSITGLDGVELKGYSFEMIEPARTVRRWTAVLTRPRRGDIRLNVEFQQPVDHVAAGAFALPIGHAGGVVYQSGVVSVEGSPELDIAITGDARAIDVGELVDAQYQPGANLLGVWEFLGDATDLAATVTRDPAYALPPAIVQRARLVTDLSAAGISVTEASFDLRTKALFLEIALPASSRLWTITLDGEPTKPQRLGNRLLVDLPARATGAAARSLSVVYESDTSELDLVQNVVIMAPELALAARGGGGAVPIPVADLQWSVSTPRGYRVLDSSGTVETNDLPDQPLAIATLGRWLFAKLGGAPGPPFPVLAKAARDQARAPTAASEQIEEMTGPRASRPPAKRRPPAAREPALAKPAPPPRSGTALVLDAVTPDMQTAAPPPTDAPVTAGESFQSAGRHRLLGARSLAINLDVAGETLRFRNLGADPLLVLRLGDARRLGFLGWSIALVVFLFGLMRLSASPAVKTRFVIGVAVAATIVAVIAGRGATAHMANTVFFAAAALAAFYLLVGTVRWIIKSFRTGHTSPASSAAVTAAMMLALAVGVAPAQAHDDGDDDDAGPPVNVPGDVIIVPYDDTSALGTVDTEQLLVPYDRFVELWNLAYPEKPIGETAPPVRYAMATGSFSAELPSGAEPTYFLLTGGLDIEVYVDEAVLVPLPVGGAVLARADLDGAPAKLSVVEAPAPQAEEQRLRRSPPEPVRPLIMVHIQGKGRHRLDLTLRAPMRRRGGWRIVQMSVPSGPATGLTLTVPDAATDVRLDNIDDRRSYETTEAGQTIRTALGPFGLLGVQWRPRVGRGATDLALRARSDAVLDVQEDGLALHVGLKLDFPRTQREELGVLVPTGYLVERVQGVNVRGWSIAATAGEEPALLSVTTLKPADEHEEFVIHLRRPGRLDVAADIDVAVPEVVGASLHNGRLLIRRSPALNVRTATAQGVSRIDVDTGISEKAGAPGSDSPLGTRPYEAYSFVTTSFALRLAARPVEARITAQFRTILRIAQRERRLESRVNITVRDRPVHRLQLSIPADLELEHVSAPGIVQWAQGPVADDQRLVTIILHAGRLGDTPVSISGRLGALGPADSVPVPRLRVPQAERQSSWIAVQVDPAFDVSAEQLLGCENALLSGVQSWLKSEQRPLTRLALRCRSDEYSGVLRLSPRASEVSCRSVSNVRVTEVAFEDTVLLEFTVRKGGVREVVFMLPAFMAEARFSVPLLRRKSVEPVADRPGWIRVSLELQDEVMDRLLVLVENDRAIEAGDVDVPLPVIETGETDRRYAAIENAGRDEVVVAASDGLQPLGRAQSEWRTVSSMLSTGPTEAFVARGGSGGGGEPRLSFRLRRREAVRTAGARIGLAETMLVLDTNGAYRARQTYRMDNFTEQHLQLALPPGAELWSATLAGLPVKPASLTPAATPRPVRTPHVKTPAGELD